MNALKHENVVIFDKATGIPSIMVKFEKPKYKNEQSKGEVPPMFIIGGKEVDAIYISKYPNKVIGGRAYSLPMVDPTISIDFDGAVQACRAKGEGWHLMTAVEWEYLLNQSRGKGILPHGNTDYGNDYYNKKEIGARTGCGLGRTLTGSGPATWNHDHTIYGVSDMCGNVWEWVAGLRIVNGIIEYIPGNNAALAHCDLSKDSKEWKRIKTERGTVRVDVENGDIAIVDLPEHEEYEPDYDGVKIADLTVELSDIPQALRDLGIIPEKRLEEENNTYVWFDATEGEYLPLRGSAFDSASISGPSALDLNSPRSNSYDGIGFRSAFYEVNGKLIAE